MGRDETKRARGCTPALNGWRWGCCAGAVWLALAGSAIAAPPAAEVAHDPHAPVSEAPEVGALSVVVINDNGLMRRLDHETNRLHAAKRTVSGKELVEQLEAAPPTPAEPVAFRRAGGAAPMDGGKLYTATSPGVVVVSGMSLCGKCDRLHPRPASGFLVSEAGVVATNYHVVAAKNNQTMVVMLSDGKVLPITGVIAANKERDLALVKVDLTEMNGQSVHALTIAEPAAVGSEVVALTHPNGRFFTMTRGYVTRYCLTRHHRSRRPVPAMEITADYARGSSGGPILNMSGQVVGMVSTTSSIYYEDDGKTQKNLQMVVKQCIPSGQILQMLGAEVAPAARR